MFTLLIALGLIVVMLVLGLGSSVLWMRPESRGAIKAHTMTSIKPGSMTIGDQDEARAA